MIMTQDDDYILVYKPGLLDLVRELNKARIKIIELEKKLSAN